MDEFRHKAMAMANKYKSVCGDGATMVVLNGKVRLFVMKRPEERSG